MGWIIPINSKKQPRRSGVVLIKIAVYASEFPASENVCAEAQSTESQQGVSGGLGDGSEFHRGARHCPSIASSVYIEVIGPMKDAVHGKGIDASEQLARSVVSETTSVGHCVEVVIGSIAVVGVQRQGYNGI